MFHATELALAQDIYKVIQDKLSLDEKDVTSVKFDFSVERVTTITLNYVGSENGRIINIEREVAWELNKELCNRFNLPFYNMHSMYFDLNYDEIPTFKFELYPFVKDKKELLPLKIDKVTLDH